MRRLYFLVNGKSTVLYLENMRQAMASSVRAKVCFIERKDDQREANFRLKRAIFLIRP